MSTTVTGHDITIIETNNLDVSSCEQALLTTVIPLSSLGGSEVIQVEEMSWTLSGGVPVPASITSYKLYCVPGNDASVASAVSTCSTCIANLGGPINACFDINHLGYNQ